MIGNNHHITRYVPRKSINEEGRADGSAFLVRPVDEDGLSVHWLEYYRESTILENIVRVRETKLGTGFGLKKSGRFIVLQAG